MTLAEFLALPNDEKNAEWEKGDGLICDVCKEVMPYPAWYHCPECNRHGFASTFGPACTGCSNSKRFGV